MPQKFGKLRYSPPVPLVIVIFSGPEVSSRACPISVHTPASSCCRQLLHFQWPGGNLGLAQCLRHIPASRKCECSARFSVDLKGPVKNPKICDEDITAHLCDANFVNKCCNKDVTGYETTRFSSFHFLSRPSNNSWQRRGVGVARCRDYTPTSVA